MIRQLEGPGLYINTGGRVSSMDKTLGSNASISKDNKILTGFGGSVLVILALGKLRREDLSFRLTLAT